MNLIDEAHFWTGLRRELVQWLDDRAPSFSEGYVAAVRLLHIPEFPARIHLICHVVRDVYRRLPAALGMKSLPRPAEVFPNMVKTLTQQWERYPSSETMKPEEIGSNVLINPQVHSCVIKLVEKSKELADQPKVGKQLAIALFRSLDRREEEFIPPWVIT